MPNSWYKEGDGGGLGELIFIEIIEFDPSFKGSLTCVWRKGSGEVKGGHSFISSFSRFIYYVPATVLGTGNRVEKGLFFPLPLMELTF